VPASRHRSFAEWVTAQPWSDGRIGATGISYVGAACDFLASSGNAAVRAIAPLSAVWDTYIDHYYPGGLLLNRLAQSYDALMVALDHDRRDLLGEFAYFKDPNLAGPAPVDEDPRGDARDAAVREHIANFRMPAFIAEFRYHDDALPYDAEFTPASFSPCQYAHRRIFARRRAAPVFRHVLDGARYRSAARVASALFLHARRSLAGSGPLPSSPTSAGVVQPHSLMLAAIAKPVSFNSPSPASAPRSSLPRP
jgi:hypothetical protein